MPQRRWWSAAGVVAVAAAAVFMGVGSTSAAGDPPPASPPSTSSDGSTPDGSGSSSADTSDPNIQAKGDPAPVDPSASNLAAVPGATACADLVAHDFTDIEGAPARVDSATIVAGDPSVPAEFCDVKAHTANVKIEVKLPTKTWTQRFVMVACGGYCGVQSYSAVNASDAGCPRLQSGELAVATTDLGHTGNAFAADGLWGLNNPTAIIDFGYLGMHKTTLAAKAIIGVFYNQGPKFNYIMGCSNGGRSALMEAQRYPTDYDGVLAGSPTIDDAVENTFEHGWNVAANRKPDNTAILTADKIPALHTAVLAKCASSDGGIGPDGGVVADPRGCKFDAKSLVCAADDDPSCLTPAQAEAANKIYSGPVDERGRHLAIGGLPYGSELAWVGSMALQPGQTFSFATSGDYTYSYDFPNYLARWSGPSGITNKNMEFSSKQFRYLMETAPAIEATNPDLSAFYQNGGKVIMWDGWADTGSSPYATLNYYDAVGKTLGKNKTDKFMKLYMPPGEYHCGGGPTPASADYLTPLMNWREQGNAATPDKIVTTFRKSSNDPTTLRSIATFPFPAISVFNGTGDPNDQANWHKAYAQNNYPRHYDWLGNDHYTRQFQKWYTPTVTVSSHG